MCVMVFERVCVCVGAFGEGLEGRVLLLRSWTYSSL